MIMDEEYAGLSMEMVFMRVFRGSHCTGKARGGNGPFRTRSILPCSVRV
jgi:hypothetical protein